MKNFKENIYPFLFAVIICLVCSFALTVVSQGLKERQQTNMVLDKRKNILKVVLQKPLKRKVSAQELLRIYNEKIQELVVDNEGRIIKGKKASEINLGKDKGLYPLYVYRENGKVMAYAFPITGRGLWSKIYGYLAIDPDGKTVRGVTFYKQAETPGLGAQIASDRFQKEFSGKKIWDEKKKKLVFIRVVKGKVNGRFLNEEEQHLVDGISGATLTGKGITKMLKKWIEIYNPFFERIRKQGASGQ